MNVGNLMSELERGLQDGTITEQHEVEVVCGGDGISHYGLATVVHVGDTGISIEAED